MSTHGLAVAFLAGLLATSSQVAAQDPAAGGRESQDTPETAKPDVPPRLVHQTKPKYPKAAFEARLEGTVEVEFEIDVKGQVGRTRIVHSVAGLDEAAVACVRQWRFQPARKGGEAVSTVALAPVTFRYYTKPARKP